MTKRNLSDGEVTAPPLASQQRRRSDDGPSGEAFTLKWDGIKLKKTADLFIAAHSQPSVAGIKLFISSSTEGRI